MKDSGRAPYLSSCSEKTNNGEKTKNELLASRPRLLEDVLLVDLKSDSPVNTPLCHKLFPDREHRCCKSSAVCSQCHGQNCAEVLMQHLIS